MSFVKSFLYNMKEAKYNPITLTHSTLYAATVTYLRILKNLVKIDSKWFRNHISETYHSKVVRLDDAAKFITINKNIELRNLEHVIPYKHAIEIISFWNNGKEKKRCKIIPESCFGCGICESKCKKVNISLILDTEKGIPLNIEELAKTSETEARI
ncbi:MAG: hypothetical protein JRJ41_12265 [Deltaproteobacteria bacterium]|nr:hypothetical protein [Deltaproteobacteria bacterium]